MWHTLSSDEVSKKLETNTEKGLTQKEAQKRQKTYGFNKIEDTKKKSIISKFIEQFKDFMIIILLIAALISMIMSYLEGTHDYMDSLIIIAIVFFNAIMGLIQESKAEKSIEELKKLSSPMAKVKRDGKIQIIESELVVPGDIVILEAGNFVPADCRLTLSYNFQVEESSLTGETVPVTKNANLILANNVSLGDTLNMAFSTTIITNGHAEAIVTDTGMNTKVGKIANMIIQDESPQTPLQKKLADVGKKLGTLCIFICIAIFIIGVFKNISIADMFMTSIGLAVAAIPEGLPAIVTIMLSIGVTKMAKKNAIIRKLPAVETLGSSSVICSDKTGTLTQNKMTVTKIYNALGELSDTTSTLDYDFILELGALCNDSIIGKKNKIEGDPTENAIVEIALKNGKNKLKIQKIMERVNEIPFDSERKMMTTIHKIKNGYRIIVKGAPDIILKKCTSYYSNSNICSLTSDKIKEITKMNEKMAESALRVIAISYKDISSLPSKIESSTIEKDLCFAGMFGMIDPPRKGVKEAVFTCKKAGIKTVMITGDHILTAKEVAKSLGIYNDGDIAITGNMLDTIPEKEFEKNIMKYSVFARVSPEHKVKIVKAFRKSGNVVAMTGDGVNDAPALKSADIGVAMGMNGTDVAKNASDMILTDDNFVTIVEAVKEGRHIYDNIKKAVHFLISTNIGEIVAIFFGLLLGFDSPLLAIHLLWINLVTDSLPALGLGLEPPDKYIMNKKPKNPKKSIFSDGLFTQIFIEGVIIGILTLLSFSIGLGYDIKVARTMAFITLGLSELVHSLNIRSDSSIFDVGFFKNKYILLAFLVGFILQVGVVLIPPLADMFDAVRLTQRQWITTLLISSLPLVIIEVKKKISEKIHGKTLYNLYKVKT